jgi:transposase
LEALPVESIVLEPPERLLPGGEALVKIGEEVSEHVDRRPASLVRVRVVRPKYKRPEPETAAAPAAESAPADRAAECAAPTAIVIAPLPERPIPRGIAGPGLLAHVLVSKYADHLPRHRQEKIFRREGLHLPRSTLCGFVQGSVALLGRVVDAMWEHARANARWVCIDATGVLVLAKDQCRRNHFWVVVAERDHVLFRHTKTHDGLVPAKLLEGFRGYALADASSLYHELYRREAAITEVGCWAHYPESSVITTERARSTIHRGFMQ